MKKVLIATAAAAALGIAGASVASAHGPSMGYGMGWGGMGMMGPGYGPGMMGPGMMGYGYGPGMMGWGGPGRSVDLSSDDVKSMLERWVNWQGNPRIKVGDVKEENDDVIVADIVTQDGSLVDRVKVDRHTGYMQRVQ